MKIIITAEIDSELRNEFQVVRKEILDKIKPLEKKEYGINKISIIPIIINITPELNDAGFFKERKLINKKDKTADIRLRIDFKQFKEADIKIKRELLIKNIIESCDIIGEKMKNEFDSRLFKDDILSLLHVNKNDLN